MDPGLTGGGKPCPLLVTHCWPEGVQAKPRGGCCCGSVSASLRRRGQKQEGPERGEEREVDFRKGRGQKGVKGNSEEERTKGRGRELARMWVLEAARGQKVRLSKCADTEARGFRWAAVTHGKLHLHVLEGPRSFPQKAQLPHSEHYIVCY